MENIMEDTAKKVVKSIRDLKESMDKNYKDFNECLDNIVKVANNRDNMRYSEIVESIKKNIKYAEDYNNHLEEDFKIAEFVTSFFNSKDDRAL